MESADVLPSWATCSVPGLLARVQQNAVVSLWCVWAAITSVLVVVRRSGLDVVGRVGLEPTTQGL